MGDPVEALNALFASRSAVAAEEPFLARDDALEYVNECERLDLAILGIEGFALLDRGLQCDGDLLRDYGKLHAATWDEFRAASNAAARAFLSGSTGERNRVFNLMPCSREWWERRRRGTL